MDKKYDKSLRRGLKDELEGKLYSADQVEKRIFRNRIGSTVNTLDASGQPDKEERLALNSPTCLESIKKARPEYRPVKRQPGNH